MTESSLTIPDVTPEARLNRAGLTALYFGSSDDPTHRRSWKAVERGEADIAVVRTETGYILFRAWRISKKSWAWQTSSMPAMAFMPYAE